MRRAVGVLVALALLSATGCRSGSEDRTAKVLLISIDTLRADYLGVYNPALDTTPNLDAFARDSVVFTDAITQATSTLPSHMSLLYSVHAFVHRAYVATQPQPLVTPPVGVLGQSGLATAAFVGGGQLRPELGANRGFDTYQVIDTRRINRRSQGKDRLDALHTEVRGFLQDHRDDDFFLFVHTYEPHWPYDPPQRFVDRFVRSDDEPVPSEPRAEEFETGYGITEDAYLATNRRAMYAAVVAYVDEFLGKLFATIEELELDDELMVVFVADHGESLGEHGALGHNRFFTEQLRVPLIVKVPGIEGRRSDYPVELLDVMPTVFAALGLEPDGYDFMGRDLTPLLKGIDDGGGADRVRMSENKGTMAVLRGDWKVTFKPEQPEATRLYNLAEDPGELVDRSAGHAELVAELIDHYYRQVAENMDLTELFPHADLETELSDDVLRELRALGYIR